MTYIALTGVSLLLLWLVPAGGDAPAGGEGGHQPTTRPDSAPTTRQASEQTRLTDFDQPDANGRWRMVNDNVMGGRSLGDVRFADGVMTFFGAINTNGGGFSSLRLPIERGTLAGTRQIVMRIKHDGRVPYRLLVIDVASRRREVLHQCELSFSAPAGEWQTVTVDLAAMQPTFRGEPINAAPLDPAAAVQIGFILNDTGDGPFELQVDWIDIVR